jgi:hypothetical protein
MKSKESEYVKKYNTEYYSKNKAKILEKGKEKIRCALCDCNIRKENRNKHEATKKHKQNEIIDQLKKAL